jgi:hypothetical protein
MPFLHDAFLALFGDFWRQLENPETHQATGSAKNEKSLSFPISMWVEGVTKSCWSNNLLM